MTASTPGVGEGIVGMLNVFVDPVTTAKKVPARLSWLWPVLVLTIVYLAFAILMQPFALQLMDATLAQRNLPPDQLDRARSMMHATTQITTPLTPVFVIGFMALIALLMKVAYAVMDSTQKFRDLFSLLAACSLIPALQYIASYFVIRAKGDPIENPEQLAPPFGLDIFMPSLHGVGLAFVNFFSLFQIWYLVVLCIGLAALTRSSKTKAFFAMTPAWLIPLLFRLMGAMFSRTAGS